MLDRERINGYGEWSRHRFPLGKFSERAGDFVTKTRERLFGKEVKAIYGIPVGQAHLTRYFTPEFFAALDIPAQLNLCAIAQNLVAKEKRNPGASTRDSLRLNKGRVVIRTDHASDFAIPWLFNFDERATAITGSELLMARLLTGGVDVDQEFTHLSYEDENIPLFLQEDRTPNLLHEIFDKLPNPIPQGSVLTFTNGQYVLEATVLPIPENFVVPQLSFVGAKERSNLDRNLRRAKATGGRILVVFKDGQQGLVQGFAQADPASGFDIFELVDAEKRKVKNINGLPTDIKALPPTEPGRAQIVLLPIKGNIEGFIRGATDAIIKGTPPPPIPNTHGVYGIDIVESGYSASQAGVVPVDFRHDGSNHEKAKTVLEWYKKDKPRYLEYVRNNAIMPIQPVAIRVIKRT